jgi:predicted dehydrogenase
LDHGHIDGMCNALIEAGGELKLVFDPDARKVDKFRETFPHVKPAASEDEILQDKDVRLVAAAAVPCRRGPLGCHVMSHGKDYFTDKTPFTTKAQLHDAKATVKETGRKYMVYYSERLHVESAVYAGQLIDQGTIGRVIQVIGLGPHRLNIASRPDWFFRKEQYGGILCDIGSHQVEQFLAYTGASDAEVVHSKVANYSHPEHPELEDFGDATLVADNGATGYFRVDWFTPDGLSSWGDGRTFILGTEGYMELRKYVNVGVTSEGDHLFLVDKTGEKHMDVEGKVGYPFFGQLILDCLNRTENAMTQAHAFKAAELCLEAQEKAMRVR